MVTSPEKPAPLPSDRKVRIALVGIGGAAQLIHLPILTEMESVELVGLSDVEDFKLSKVSDRYGVPGFMDCENMIRKVNPDVVMVCAPTINHMPLALTALQTGAHVIVEKPVARNLSEAIRLQEAAQRHNKHVLIAMNQRFRQDVSILKNFLKAGDLGVIWRIRSGWLKRFGNWHRSPWLDQKKISGGGVLMDLGIQLLDMAMYLMDYPKPVRTVAYMHHQNIEREVEDTLTAAVTFDNNAILHIDCSWGVMSEHDTAYTIFEGSKASASLNPLVLHQILQDELVSVTPVKTADPRDLYQASFESQLHHFIAALRGKVDPISTIDEATQVMKAVDSIYRSAETEREVLGDEQA